jgi:hypothetical protein
MSAHSRRHSVLDDARHTTVNFTASFAERIPAPIYVGSGHYMELPYFVASPQKLTNIA